MCCETLRSVPPWLLPPVLPFMLAVLLVPHLTLAEIYKLPLKRSSYFIQKDVLENRHLLNQEDNLRGKPGQGYYMEMSIGTPPQKLNVLVDTGSSNFAVAAAPHTDIHSYFHIDRSATYRKMETKVYVPYTQGNWRGHLGRDVVTMSSLPTISVEANIAFITSSDKFFINGSHWQGILGLAYADIARPDSSVQPYFESLVEETGINNTFSMQLCGTIDTVNLTDVSMGGTMIVGGVDENLYEGAMLYAPLHKEWYYEVIIMDIAVGDNSLKLDCKEYNFDKTIVDSGTTNLRLPHRVFEKVKDAIKEASHTAQVKVPLPTHQPGFWLGQEILCWKEGKMPWNDFPSLTLHLAASRNTSLQLVISPQQYLRAVKGDEQTTKGRDCFKFAVAPSDTGTVLGAVVMEAFYVVFDRHNSRIGFAKSTCPNRDPNTVTSHVKGPYLFSGDTWDCAYVKPASDQSTLVTIAYVMAGVCGACLLPLILMLLQWQWQRWRQRHTDRNNDDSSLLKEDEESH